MDTRTAAQKRTDARGVETHYKYDSLNRPLQVWYTGLGGDDNGSIRPALPSGVAATSDVTITYNNFSSPQVGNGQVSSVTDGAGSESYVYDSVARLSSKTRVIDSRSYQTQYLYNTADQLTTLIYPSGKRVRTNHDSRGRMSGADNVDSFGNVLANYVTSVGYNTASQVTGVNLANGVNENYGYSADRLQLTSQSAVKGANTLMSLTYNYAASAGASGAGTTAGNSGQLMSISGTVNSLSRSQAFTYDNVGRLLTATGWSAWNRRFAYDRWGNRAGMWDALSGGNQLQNIAIALTGGVANNRIANVNGVSYSYDASGNCTWDGAHSYAYDGEGRQANVDSGVTSSSGFDSANRRLKKIAGGVTTHYVWEGAQVIAEYNGSTSALISDYIYAGARMVARDQGGVLRYNHQDRLSTRMITDSTGNVVGTEDHLPFGEDGGVIGESEKHRFTNYERDSESGTDYALNRQHQMNNGRFMRPDPVGGTITDPQSLNRYTYVQNDPVNLSDPLGLVVYYCPPQYSSCATVSVSINGVLFDVNVGFTSGHVTFLWNQLGNFQQQQIAQLVKEAPLPEGFDIFFRSVLDFVTERTGSITDQARTKTQRNIQKEIDDCTKTATAVLTGEMDKARGERQLKQLILAASRALAQQGLKYALRKGLENGSFSRFGAGAVRAATGANTLLSLAANPAVAVPGLFIGMSIFMAPGAREMQLQNQIWEAREKCKEAVLEKYGLR